MPGKKIGVFDVLNYIILGLLSLTTIYPFINMIAVSLSPMSEVAKGAVLIFPKKVTLEAYEYIIKYSELGSAYKVTLFVTIVGGLINLTLTTLGGYVLANKQIPGRSFLSKMVVFTMLFHGGTIPMYIVVKNLHLTNTVWSMILPHAINTYFMILMRNFMMGIPTSLSESARIDGCNEYMILLRIILPLSMPIIATLTLFYGVSRWNEYTSAILYITRSSLRPLQVVIRAMYEEGIEMMEAGDIAPPSNTVRAAAVVFSTVPILCVYPFVQKYFVQGIMVGSVKG